MNHSLSVNNDKVNAKIKISLKKPESGGVRYFSVTGTFWKPGQVRIDRNMIASGAALHSIKEQFPELAIFADLHLRDHKGAPSSAVENGIYFAKPESGCDGAGPEKLAQFFDITIDKAQQLCKAGDREHFCWLIEFLKIDEDWADKAQKAINILEGLTGEVFSNDVEKSHYHRLEGQIRESFLERLNHGYYSREEIYKREKERRWELINSLIQREWAIEADSIERITLRREVNVALISHFPDKHGNWYYHENTKSITFTAGTGIKFSEDQLNQAKEIVRRIVPEIKITVKS